MNTRYIDIGYTLEQTEETTVVDAADVRHGEWVRTTRAPKSTDGYYFWNAPLETVFVCSECGRVELVEEPYCNCGAKMC